MTVVILPILFLLKKNKTFIKRAIKKNNNIIKRSSILIYNSAPIPLVYEIFCSFLRK